MTRTKATTADLLAELVSLGAEVDFAAETQAKALDRRNEIVAALRAQGMSWVRLAGIAGVTPAALKLAARKRDAVKS